MNDLNIKRIERLIERFEIIVDSIKSDNFNGSKGFNIYQTLWTINLELFSLDTQILLAIEELNELSIALYDFLKIQKSKENFDAVMEEIADAEIMLSQLIIYFGTNKKCSEDIYEVIEENTYIVDKDLIDFNYALSGLTKLLSKECRYGDTSHQKIMNEIIHMKKIINHFKNILIGNDNYSIVTDIKISKFKKHIRICKEKLNK